MVPVRLAALLAALGTAAAGYHTCSCPDATHFLCKSVEDASCCPRWTKENICSPKDGLRTNVMTCFSTIQM